MWIVMAYMCEGKPHISNPVIEGLEDIVARKGSLIALLKREHSHPTSNHTFYLLSDWLHQGITVNLDTKVQLYLLSKYGVRY